MRPAVLKVLIIEDVDTMRSLLEQVMGSIRGFEVSGSARNSWEARLELTRNRPDVVLLDEVLPGESSRDLLLEIHGLGIPVFLITGIENPTHAIPSQALGRLAKPSWESIEEDGKRLKTLISEGLSRRKP